jgi:secreted protein with Ig-like and vWFA domain
MARRATSLFQLSLNTMRLGLEAQSVIALRTMKCAAGGAAASDEINLMVSEKVRATIDAQFTLARAAMAGRADGPAKAVALYRRRVRANQRRLAGGA